MSNSPLVKHIRLSPNRTSPRNHVIDTITIHCVAGQCTVEALGNLFAPASRGGASNYGIGKDGRIGMYVEEKDRAWTSGGKDRNGNPIRVNGISGSDNDHRAITIEVASDSTAPYAVTDKAYVALIELCADICKRNGIKELKWKADKSLVGQVDKQNMTVHRWFANKACPGDYLYNRHADIAKAVNAKLGINTNASVSANKPLKTVYKVQTGAFKSKNNAVALRYDIVNKGFNDCMVVYENGIYKVQVGAYVNKVNANSMALKLNAKGFDTCIVTKN